MMILYTMSILAFLVASLLMMLAIIIGEKSNKDREKLSPFECGFDPFKKARIPFSLRFFLITIIFLVFDVEIALLLPLGLISKSSDPFFIFFTAFFLMIVLTAGIIHEWNQGSLSWIK